MVARNEFFLWQNQPFSSDTRNSFSARTFWQFTVINSENQSHRTYININVTSTWIKRNIQSNQDPSETQIRFPWVHTLIKRNKADCSQQFGSYSLASKPRPTIVGKFAVRWRKIVDRSINPTSMVFSTVFPRVPATHGWRPLSTLVSILSHLFSPLRRQSITRIRENLLMSCFTPGDPIWCLRNNIDLTWA